MSVEPGVSAGWHPDPYNEHELRYWDGAAWTGHTADPGAGPPPSATAPAGPAAEGPGTAASKPPVSSKARTRAVLILVGGGLMAIGALLPWETSTLNGQTIQSVKGTSEGAGGIVLVAGLLAALLAVLFLAGTLGRRAGIATLVVTAIGSVFLVGNLSAISDDIDKVNQTGASKGTDSLFGSAFDEVVKVDATLGIGIILAAVGAILVIVASIMLLRTTRATA